MINSLNFEKTNQKDLIKNSINNSISKETLENIIIKKNILFYEYLLKKYKINDKILKFIHQDCDHNYFRFDIYTYMYYFLYKNNEIEYNEINFSPNISYKYSIPVLLLWNRLDLDPESYLTPIGSIRVAYTITGYGLDTTADSPDSCDLYYVCTLNKVYSKIYNEDTEKYYIISQDQEKNRYIVNINDINNSIVCLDVLFNELLLNINNFYYDSLNKNKLDNNLSYSDFCAEMNKSFLNKSTHTSFFTIDNLFYTNKKYEQILNIIKEKIMHKNNKELNSIIDESIKPNLINSFNNIQSLNFDNFKKDSINNEIIKNSIKNAGTEESKIIYFNKKITNLNKEIINNKFNKNKWINILKEYTKTFSGDRISLKLGINYQAKYEVLTNIDYLHFNFTTFFLEEILNYKNIQSLLDRNISTNNMEFCPRICFQPGIVRIENNTGDNLLYKDVLFIHLFSPTIQSYIQTYLNYFIYNNNVYKSTQDILKFAFWPPQLLHKLKTIKNSEISDIKIFEEFYTFFVNYCINFFVNKIKKDEDFYLYKLYCKLDGCSLKNPVNKDPFLKFDTNYTNLKKEEKIKIKNYILDILNSENNTENNKLIKIILAEIGMLIPTGTNRSDQNDSYSFIQEIKQVFNPNTIIRKFNENKKENNNILEDLNFNNLNDKKIIKDSINNSINSFIELDYKMKEFKNIILNDPKHKNIFNNKSSFFALSKLNKEELYKLNYDICINALYAYNITVNLKNKIKFNIIFTIEDPMEDGDYEFDLYLTEYTNKILNIQHMYYYYFIITRLEIFNKNNFPIQNIKNKFPYMLNMIYDVIYTLIDLKNKKLTTKLSFNLFLHDKYKNYKSEQLQESHNNINSLIFDNKDIIKRSINNSLDLNSFLFLEMYKFLKNFDISSEKDKKYFNIIKLNDKELRTNTALLSSNDLKYICGYKFNLKDKDGENIDLSFLLAINKNNKSETFFYRFQIVITKYKNISLFPVILINIITDENKIKSNKNINFILDEIKKVSNNILIPLINFDFTGTNENKKEFNNFLFYSKHNIILIF